MSDNYNTLAEVLTTLETLDDFSAPELLKCTELLMRIRDVAHRRMNASIDLLTGDNPLKEDS